MTMKISKGKYVDQFAIGVTWLRYPNVTWSVIFDLGLWYVEVSNDFKDNVDWNPYRLETSIRCDRCGSPDEVYRRILEVSPTKDEWVCDECIRYEDYMNSLSNVKPKVDKKKRKVKSKTDKNNEESETNI
jgi:hypothetical protein